MDSYASDERPDCPPLGGRELWDDVAGRLDSPGGIREH
jgi:hypothetical protein